MFEELPNEFVPPTDLQEVAKTGGTLYLTLSARHTLLFCGISEHARSCRSCIANLIASLPCPDTRKVYATVVSRKDYLVRKESGATSDAANFDVADFDAHMDQYKSTFFDEVCIPSS